MPRRPLAQINGNSLKQRELSLFTHGLIIGKRENGAFLSKISQKLQIPVSTISGTIQRNSVRNNGKSSAQSGRPKSYLERDKQHVI
jgi:hypothetical protein